MCEPSVWVREEGIVKAIRNLTFVVVVQRATAMRDSSRQLHDMTHASSLERGIGSMQWYRLGVHSSVRAVWARVQGKAVVGFGVSLPPSTSIYEEYST